MMRFIRIAAALVFVANVTLAAGAQTPPTPPPQAPTAPGTVINNTASATYSDANNQTYSAASNLVSTTVQNAPSLVISPQATQGVAAGQLVLDNYTLYNTGNGAATFQVTGPATPVGTGGTFQGYVVNNAATGTCSISNPCTSTSQVNTYLATLTASNPISAGSPGPNPIVGVLYRVTGSNPPASITTSLSATSTQAVIAGQSQQVSAAATASDTDSTAADARIDLQKVAVSPTTVGGNVTFTITGNNGGGFAARDLASVNALLGNAITGGHDGVLVTDRVPKFTGATTQTQLVNDAAASLASSLSVDSYKIVYSTDPNGAGSWSTTFSANATFIGLYIYATSGPLNTAGTAILPSAPSGSSGAGLAPPQNSVTTPQFTLTFHVTQPAGNGVGNANALSNIADAVGGGNPSVNGTIPVVGPGGINGSSDSPTLSLAPAVTNTTSSTGTAIPGGASNTVNASAYASAAAFVGPIANPTVSGQSPVSATYTQNNDFTAIGFACTNNAGPTFPQSSVAGSCTVPTAGIQVPNTFQNSGNAADVFTVSVTPPAGFTATLYTTSCPPPGGGFTTLPSASLNPAPSTVCTLGTAFGTTSGGVTSGVYPTSSTPTPNQVASGATADFIVVYKAAAGVTPGAVADALVTVSGTQSGSFSGDTNTTHNDLYPGGAISFSKVQRIVSDNCAAAGGSPAFPTGGANPVPVCPGGVIAYDLLFANSAPAFTTATNASNTEPAFATKSLTSLNMTITEDGAATVNGVANSWATYTFGLNGAVAQTNTGTPAGNNPTAATFVYSNGSAFASGTYPVITAGYLKFVGTVTSINPGQSATLTFTVTVK